MINSITDIQEIGPLFIYRKQNTSHPMGDGGFYYIDKRYMIEQGPFMGAYLAVNHWNSVTIPLIMEQSKSNPAIQEAVLPPDNVIYVDFKAKRRLK
jgi:hypothetical protein